MLLDLKRHLAERGPSTLEEVAARFDLERETAEGALDLLVRRGDVVAEPLFAMCAGCTGACSGACGMSRVMLYRTSRPDR
jgi:predicted ArsR family transcriptional regulator